MASGERSEAKSRRRYQEGAAVAVDIDAKLLRSEALAVSHPETRESLM